MDTPHLELVLAYGYRQKQICSGFICHFQSRSRSSLLAQTRAHANKAILSASVHIDITSVGYFHHQPMMKNKLVSQGSLLGHCWSKGSPLYPAQSKAPDHGRRVGRGKSSGQKQDMEQQNVTDTGGLSWDSQSRAVPHDSVLPLKDRAVINPSLFICSTKQE